MIPITDLVTKPSAIKDKQALVFGGKTWSYAEISEDVDRVASHLFAAGYCSGDRLLIYLENCYEMLLAILACFKMGIIIVQTYPDYSEAELAYIIENSRARGIISSLSLYPKLEKCRVEGSIYLTDLKEAQGSCSPFADLLRKADSPAPTFAPDLDQPLLISYTSGTTGKRKGVIQTYRSISSGIESIIRTLKEETFVRPLLFSSLGNNGALMFLVSPTFWLNGTLILTADDRTETVLAAIQKERPTFFFTFPFYLKHLLKHSQAHPISYQSLKVVLVGGDVVNLELYDLFTTTTHLPLSQGYGMTESHCMIMNLSSLPAKRGALGLPAYGVRAKIIDAQGNEVPIGIKGQLIIQREAVCSGYWDLPEETKKTLKGGWLYTGDLAYRDGDGYYWYCGRMKNLIIREAENISPIEVEEAICKHPSVQAVGVIGVLDEDWGQAIRAVIELKERKTLSLDELTVFLKDLLSPYKIPTQISFVPKLPRTLTGKIDRKNLEHL